jgi:4-amino-4-deoxy-L-arabinose transferase-like glycosyltransferase
MLQKFDKTSFVKIIPIVIVLIVTLFLRLFNFENLLGFWYDQGRDALVVWDMVQNGKFTLIGPQMGFTGIFRGGWYYYLITPFYMFGHGNPVIPAIFLVLTTVVAILVLFLIGKEIGGKKTGLLAATVASVSVYIIGASRWFSDPTPTLLISTILIWSLFNFLKGKKWALPLSGFLSGMALQFSAATEIFYLPAIIFIVFLVRKRIKVDFKKIMLTVFLFIIPFAPQIFFEIRHPGVQTNALINFLFHEKTFTWAFWEIVKTRIPFDYNMLASKFWINGSAIFAPFFVIFVTLIIFNWNKLWKSDKFKVVFVLAAAPFIGTLFFVSNLGGVYEYYFTGYSPTYLYFFQKINS